MDTNLSIILEDIKDRTSIDVTIYNMLGEKVASTLKKPHNYINVATSKFKNGIFCSKQDNICCFLFNSYYNIYMGIIDGIDETTQNYAFMISSIIENSLSKNDSNIDKEQSLKQILTGEATSTQIKRVIKNFGSINKPCFVLAIACANKKIADVINFLEQLAGDGEDIVLLIEDEIIAYIKYIENENDFQSALDFAEMINSNIEQELSIKVKIGVGSYAKNAYELSNAYLQGNNAVKTGILSNNKGRIFSYKEFVLMRMVEEIPDNILKKYLDILLDKNAKDILNDNEMVSTAEEFLANSLNISETSRHLYMHRNTLMYRLDKIEKAMGLNIRRFSDAVTFRLIMILYKYLKY